MFLLLFFLGVYIIVLSLWVGWGGGGGGRMVLDWGSELGQWALKVSEPDIIKDKKKKSNNFKI